MRTTNDTNLNPRLALLVHVTDDGEATGVALVERDSIELEFGEESGDFEAHTATDIQTDPTSEDPKLSFSGARAIDNSGLELLGAIDGEGNYQRGPGRRWDAVHVRYYEGDDLDAEPEKVDRLENVRWDLGSNTPDDNVLLFDAEGHVGGELRFNVPPVLVVQDGETYTITSGTTETFTMTTVKSGGTLTQETDSTLNTTG